MQADSGKKVLMLGGEHIKNRRMEGLMAIFWGVFFQQGKWVSGAPVTSYFEMEMGACAVSGCTSDSHSISGFQLGSRGYDVFLQMGISGLHTIRMGDYDEVAVSALLVAYMFNSSVESRPHSISFM